MGNRSAGLSHPGWVFFPCRQGRCLGPGTLRALPVLGSRADGWLSSTGFSYTDATVRTEDTNRRGSCCFSSAHVTQAEALGSRDLSGGHAKWLQIVLPACDLDRPDNGPQRCPHLSPLNSECVALGGRRHAMCAAGVLRVHPRVQANGQGPCRRSSEVGEEMYPAARFQDGAGMSRETRGLRKHRRGRGNGCPEPRPAHGPAALLRPTSSSGLQGWDTSALLLQATKLGSFHSSHRKQAQ